MAMMTRTLRTWLCTTGSIATINPALPKKRFEDDLQRAKDAAMAKNGYSEERNQKLKRAKADPIIAPAFKGQVLWEVSVEGPSSAPFIGRKVPA